MKNSALIILIFIFFLALENFFPLRARKEKTFLRIRENFFLILSTLPFTRLLSYPLVYAVASRAQDQQWGLLNAFGISSISHFILSFLLLDYFLYWWHWANHNVIFFWRFHQVHHADKDMDSSTALRFHFGELVLSSMVRIVLVLIFGFSIEALLVFEVAVICFAIFHHSNLKLPEALENILIKVFVTPHFHQNHHSFFQKETDSNYSAIFSVWDRIHKTHTKEIETSLITIGLPAFEKIPLSFWDLITMPFVRVKNWPKEFISRK